ncbi:protein enabled homolog [Pocillopora verrucosa]|uniref:protein enabled homolog n=1 Tax=Pocillopora verrucosa TaxID=203993 RepID=UPI00333F9B53
MGDHVHVINMDWLEREIVMEEQLERGREEQREREEQTKREEQRRGEERIKRDERRKREREWKAQQEREKRLGRKRERRQEMRGVEWERRRVGVAAKKGPGMILTREEIREEFVVTSVEGLATYVPNTRRDAARLCLTISKKSNRQIKQRKR